MVVPHQGGTTRASARAARLAAHDKLTARIARGLEPALLDNTLVTITALEAKDPRSFHLHVAEPSALLTAKAIKIGVRLDEADTRPDRLKEKGALDAFRLLQAVDTADVVRGFRSHQGDEHAAAVTAEAIDTLRTQGSTPQGRLARLAADAAHGDPTVAPAFGALVTELLAALADQGLSDRAA